MLLKKIDHREGASRKKLITRRMLLKIIYHREGASQKNDLLEGASKNIDHREGASQKNDHLEGASNKTLITARVPHKNN